MALSLSTGLRQFLTGEGSLRKAFEDGILNIYSGAAPANADAAPTGVLLAKDSWRERMTWSHGAGKRAAATLLLITVTYPALLCPVTTNLRCQTVDPTKMWHWTGRVAKHGLSQHKEGCGG